MAVGLYASSFSIGAFRVGLAPPEARVDELFAQATLKTQIPTGSGLGALSNFGGEPLSNGQLLPGGVQLRSVGLRVVPVAEHPGQFLALQANHDRAVVGDAAGIVNLPR